MKLDQVLAQLCLGNAEAVFAPHWEESVAALPADGPLFLHPAEVRANREFCGLKPETEEVLVQAAARITASPALRLLAWHCFRLLYDHLDYNGMAQWPALDAALGESQGTFYLLVTMGLVPRVRQVHGQLGVPAAVTRDTCSQVGCVAGVYARLTGGRVGVTARTIFWMRHYTAGRIFRIGRMEYMLRPFGGRVLAYRHRQSGATVALAAPGLRFNGAGFVDGAGGIVDEKNGWSASFRADAETVVGYPLAPHGLAVRRQVSLPVTEWECVLKEGDLDLDLHIPAGGHMTVEACGDSMRRAAAFFGEHFPAQPFRAITSSSWIFNPQLAEVPISSDNLVRYQRELYLYPVPSSGTDGLWFIFLRDDFTPAALPRDTSLRRGVADYLAQGHTWHGGGMFYLTADLPSYGTRHYRSQWPPPGLGL